MKPKSIETAIDSASTPYSALAFYEERLLCSTQPEQIAHYEAIIAELKAKRV